MIALLLWTTLALSPGGEDATATAAADAYLDARYEEARALYLELLSAEGVARGPVLYDLGNCAFRMGDPARAALCYRRALLRLPGDEEVEFNLQHAERALGLDPPPPGWWEAGWRSAVESPWATVAAPGPGLAIAGGLQFLALAGIFLRRRRRVPKRWMLVLVLGWAWAVPAVRACWFPPSPEGVVLIEGVGLREGPRADLPVLRELVPGSLVHVEGKAEPWLRIVDPEGVGWIEGYGVGLVD